MSEISYDAACQMFNTEVTQQYQNLSKLKDTIEKRHGLRGTHLNVPVSDLLEMNNVVLRPPIFLLLPLMKPMCKSLPMIII